MKLVRLGALSCAFVAAVLTSGCQTGSSSRNQSIQAQQLEILKSHEAQIGQMNAKINSFQDSNAQLVMQISQLNGKVSSLEQRNQALEGGISSLKQELSAESQERQAAISKMIDQISKEMAKVASSAASARASARSSSGPVGSGSFVEYKVQRGATLNAIAKAYGVPVDEIRQANKMKNDNLREGQILYIPKK